MANTLAQNGGFLAGVNKRNLVMPLGLVAILGLMILPLPPIILDSLLALNITLALMVLLTAIQVRQPLDFSVFPSLLLVTTLFRLSLNVSTTRLILLEGDSGTDGAGQKSRSPTRIRSPGRMRVSAAAGYARSSEPRVM